MQLSRHQPVVQRTMILELERAERMRDALERIRQRVRVVVHRVDAPRVAGAMVGRVANPIERRVAHVEVRRRHVDLRAQHVRAVRELAGAHPREEIEVLLDRPVAVRAVASRLGQRAAIARESRRRSGCPRTPCRAGSARRRTRRAARSSRTRTEQRVPLEAEPLHVLPDGVDVLDVFLGRVRVVEAEVAGAPASRSATPKLRQIDLAWPMCR